jgi:hypothetical protein
LLKSVSAKHKSEFAALIVPGNGDSRQIAEKLLVQLKANKQLQTFIKQSVVQYFSYQ